MKVRTTDVVMIVVILAMAYYLMTMKKCGANKTEKMTNPVKAAATGAKKVVKRVVEGVSDTMFHKY